MENILTIKINPIEYHLFIGGWKIHHIVSDEIFKSRTWEGIKIHTGADVGESWTSYDQNMASRNITQDIEIIPGNHNDLHYWLIKIDGKIAVTQRRFGTKGQNILIDLRQNEGLTAYEFHNKFNLHGNDIKYFSGKIVHLTDFRYEL